MSNEKNNTGINSTEKKADDSSAQLGSSRIFLPFFVLLLTECLFFFSNSQGVILSGPVIPMGFGLIKDLLDIFLVVIFPWHGWVVIPSLLVAILMSANARRIVSLFLCASIATGLIATYFGFREISASKFVMGVLTYAAINGFVFLTLLATKFVFEEIRKCLR